MAKKTIKEVKENLKNYAERRGKENGYNVKVTESTVRSVPKKYRITVEFTEADFVNLKMQKPEKQSVSTPVRKNRIITRNR